MKQPEHSSRRSCQVAWTIVIHCSTACLRALSGKFSPFRIPPLGFSLELGEGNISRQFCVSCTGFHVQRRVDFKLACFVFSSLSGQAPPYLADDIHLVSEGPIDAGSTRPPTDCAPFHANTTHLTTGALLLSVHEFGTASQHTCATTTLQQFQA